MKNIITIAFLLMTCVVSAQNYQQAIDQVDSMLANTVVELTLDPFNPATSVVSCANLSNPTDSAYVFQVILVGELEDVTNCVGVNSGMNGLEPGQQIYTCGTKSGLDPGTRYYGLICLEVAENFFEWMNGNVFYSAQGDTVSIETMPVSTHVESLGLNSWNINSSRSQMAWVYNSSGQIVSQFRVGKGQEIHNIPLPVGVNFIRFEDGVRQRLPCFIN